MPLLITDDGDNVVYTSRALHGAAAFVTPEESRFAKRTVLLAGKRYHFYLDAWRLAAEYGFTAEGTADALFDLHALAKRKQTVSLETLTRLFAEEYAKELRMDGVLLSLRYLAREDTVTAPVDGVLLCLALMVRICAGYGRTVQLSALRDGEVFTLFADAPRSAESIGESPFLQTLFTEVAAEAGLSATCTESDGGCTCALSLTPPDVGLMGFKQPISASSRAKCRAFMGMFL